MLRIALVAALLWSSWSAIQPDLRVFEAAASAAGPACASGSGERSDDARWSAVRQAGAVTSISSWRILSVHLRLAGAHTLSEVPVDGAARLPFDRTQGTPPHLLRIPLLI